MSKPVLSINLEHKRSFSDKFEVLLLYYFLLRLSQKVAP